MPPKISSRPEIITARFGADFENVDPQAKEVAARLVQLVALFEHNNLPLFELHQINRGIFSALVTLRLAGKPYELRNRELMDSMLLTSGGITNVCRKLVELGLVKRNTDSDDGRSVYFQLTDQGIKVANELIPAQHLLERRLVESLSADEKQTLCALLKKLAQPFDL